LEVLFIIDPEDNAFEAACPFYLSLFNISFIIFLNIHQKNSFSGFKQRGHIAKLPSLSRS
jgi:hypothetical protein